MRLTITTNVSVDGVMRGLGGADEDRRGGFDRGGWAIPLLDTEAEAHIKEVYGGAAAAAIGDLKAQQDGELVVPGSGALARWLLANGLVDQLDLLTYPVVIGQGTRLFPATGPDIALDLVESRAFPKGITLQVYRPAGRPRYATG